MEKRTKLALVVLVGLLLIGLGLYLLLSPFFAGTNTQQPPSLPGQVTPNGGTPTNGTPTTSPTGTGTTAPPVQATLRTLENRARTVVERIGSGVSADGFRGYQDVLLDTTASGRTQLVLQQQAMQTAHPATGPSFGISTQAVSSGATTGAAGDAQIVVTVEAVQREDAGSPATASTPHGKRIMVTFARQADGSYLIDSVTWSDISL